ncbi:MAG: hydantoinase B/oxoprolinase family protein [Ramlibacter sp.]|nr:hydantoinase B/oxoprolinase family protein [Ramlibacter sp.]
MTMGASSGFQRIHTDLIWQRIIALLEDQAQTLIRTAFSTTTREAGDLSAGFFDRRARMVAQAITGTPGHVNSMAQAVVHFLDLFPLDSLKPGDVLLSNDPWLCSGHLHDFTVVTPVFHRGRAVGAVANTIHVVDIGGLGFGPDGHDVFEEGLCIPPCKVVHAGKVDAFIVHLIRINVREPDQVIGDLYASMAGNDVAVRQLISLLDEFALDDFEGIADSIIGRTRAVVEERIGLLRDGTCRRSLRMDGYEGEVDLRLALTVDGREIRLDFSGSSPESRRGINVVLNYTKAYATFGINCIINPDIPCNHGSLAPLIVTAPPGSILNAQRPAAVSARHMIGHMLPDLVLDALYEFIPDRVPAEGAGLIWNPSIRGIATDGRPYATVTFNAGGGGAHRDRDGWSTTAFPSGVRTMPVEAVEATVPLLFVRKELRPDSGGPGKFRGGLGQTIEFKAAHDHPFLINAMFDRTRFAAKGRVGGLSGAAGEVRLRSGKPAAAKGLQQVDAGDSVILQLPGGGGFGHPRERDRHRVHADLRGGYVSAEAAEQVYGFTGGSDGQD